MSDAPRRFVHCLAANRAVSYRQINGLWLVEILDGAKVIDTRDAGSEWEAHRRAEHVAAALAPRAETHEQPEML